MVPTKISTSFRLIVLAGAFLVLPQIASASTSLSTFVELAGEAGGDDAGYSTATGDINGDGYIDLVVGADQSSDGFAFSGAAYVVYGQADTLSLTSLSSGVEFTGEAAYDYAGIGVATGDINGDGYDDVVVAAHGNDDGAVGAGAVYVIYGQAANLTSGSLSTQVEFTGEVAEDSAGRSVATGDFNGDGFADILIGAFSNDDAASGAGAAYVVYGQATTLSSGSLSTKVEFTGEVGGDLAGVSVATGDINGDNYDDLLVGAHLNDDSASNAGALYLVYGQATTLSSASLSTAVEFKGEVATDLFGYASATGDVNGDGYDDILVGAYANDDGGSSAGAAYLIYGQASILASNATAVEFTGEASTDFAGYAVALGDVTGDGYADLIIAASSNDDGAVGAGAIYLVNGSATTLTAGSLGSYTEFTGVTASDSAGASVDAGDFNGDQFVDILVGAIYRDDGGTNAGAAYVGYLYVDADRDTVPGTAGVLATGTDCNDSDATVTTDQTYYLDADADGLGTPETTTLSCTSTAPAGYVDNDDDTNDSISNAGIEIDGDEVDNDGDGEVDEVNTLTENGAHPEFSDDDVISSEAYAAAITNMEGTTNGNLRVTFADNSVYRYDIFTLTTSKTTLVKLRPDTSLAVAVQPKAKNIALVNLLSGEILSTKSVNDKSHSDVKLLVKDLRADGKYQAVVVAKRKTKTVHIDLFSIKLSSLTLKFRDEAKVKNTHILASKTKVKDEIIKLRRESGQVETRFKVTQKYHLSEQ